MRRRRQQIKTKIISSSRFGLEDRAVVEGSVVNDSVCLTIQDLKCGRETWLFLTKNKVKILQKYLNRALKESDARERENIKQHTEWLKKIS